MTTQRIRPQGSEIFARETNARTDMGDVAGDVAVSAASTQSNAVLDGDLVAVLDALLAMAESE